VLEAVNPPDGTTRYIDQVVAFNSPDVTFSFISLRKLLWFDYDVVHFHWPEMLVRHRSKIVERAKCFIFDRWIHALKRRKIAIVRTLHNPRPHEGTRECVARSLELLDSVTDVFVSINASEAARDGGVYIPHGHYRDRFARYEKSTPVPGRLVYAGLIRPYKGIESLLTAFEELDDEATSLRVVGKPTHELGQLITEASERHPGISARLEFVPDNAFVREITEAELVCLPYRDLHNSGILLVALSLDRPVLVPDTPSTRALAEEVGPGWVIPFTGEVSSRDIASAIGAVRRGRRTATPVLADRDWEHVGRRYSEAFKDAWERAAG
jgi:beta-1,4-mannosyltransferase